MRLCLHTCLFVTSAWAAPLPPFPLDYRAVPTTTRPAEQPQREAWNSLDLPLRQSALFPGEAQVARDCLNVLRAETLVLATLRDQIKAQLTPEQRYLSYGAKFQALERYAKTLQGLTPRARLELLQLQLRTTLALPPDLQATLAKFRSDQEASLSLRQRLVESVSVNWEVAHEKAPVRPSLRVSHWDHRLVPLADAGRGMADLLRAYVADWYVGNMHAVGSVLGIRPVADGFVGPSLGRVEVPIGSARRVLPSMLEQTVFQAPTVRNGVEPVASRRWPVTGVLLRGGVGGRAALDWDGLGAYATAPEGLIVVFGAVRERRTQTVVFPAAAYDGLRPLYWLQEEYRQLEISPFHLLTTRLAGATNADSFYGLCRGLGPSASLDPRGPEFFLLQSLFPGSLSDGEGLKRMLADPEGFAAAHLAKLALQPERREDPWRWEVDCSLYFYWHQ